MTSDPNPTNQAEDALTFAKSEWQAGRSENANALSLLAIANALLAIAKHLDNG